MDGTTTPPELIPFPGGRTTVDGELPEPPSPNWWGSLIGAQTDGSKLEYKRNRYYDPHTGRFTQEDPIGLAGGLNLYGFAAGDPINFDDPFGLTTCPPVCPQGPLSPGGLFVRGPVRPGMFAGAAARGATGDVGNYGVVGVSGTLGNVTCGGTGGAVAGSGCGVSINTPSAGASLDVGIRFRDATGDPVTGGVTYGVGKHLGVTVTNETVMLNIGVSTPTAWPVTPTVDLPSVPGGVQPGSITQRPDATAVKRPSAGGPMCPGPSCPLQ